MALDYIHWLRIYGSISEACLRRPEGVRSSEEGRSCWKSCGTKVCSQVPILSCTIPKMGTTWQAAGFSFEHLKTGLSDRVRKTLSACQHCCPDSFCKNTDSFCNRVNIAPFSYIPKQAGICPDKPEIVRTILKL